MVNVETIDPKVISSAEASRVAEDVSEVTEDIGAFIGGTGGAYLGTQLGGAAGGAAASAIPHPILKFLSGGLGSILGGGIGLTVGAHYGGEKGKEIGYVCTKNLLTGFHLTTGHGVGEKEQILMNAKSLIAVELAGGNMLFEPDCDSKLQKYYQDECKNAIETAMKNFGWKKVNVEFKY